MKDLSDNIVIRNLESFDEIKLAYPLVSKMYPNMSLETFEFYVKEMMENNGFRSIAAFLDDKMVGVSGYWVFTMLYCGRYLQASNIVVDKNLRNRRIGSKILHYLEEKAKKLGCQKIVLDSYTENKKSHALYYRNEFYIRGFHFMKDL
jgi:GNAT superfamily N-acetyltransferase